MSSGSSTTVVVGAGAAGVQAATSLRDLGWPGPVVLIGEEREAPYQRPPLSKAFLSAPTSATTRLRAEDHYAAAGIALRSGVRVTSVDLTRRHVLLDDGTELGYDALVLATGARNRLPPVPGLAEAGALALRSLAEATALRRRLADVETVAVLGGGVVGLELAATATALGRQVTVVEALPRVLARMASEGTARQLQTVHERSGTAFVLGSSVIAVERDAGGRFVLTTSTGQAVVAQLLLVAAGAAPDTDLAAAAGLEVSDGVIVGPDLRASDPRVFAVGDCARFPSPFAAGERVRLESMQNALDQGRHVARVLTGDPAPYAEVPWFWSDQGPLRLQVAGLPQPHDEEVVVGDAASDRCTRLLFRRGRLVVGESLNRPLDHIALRRLLTGSGRLTPDEARREDFDLRLFVQSQAT